MSETKRKVPKLRFPGFTEDWEQRKLGEIMEVTSVKRIHQSDWSKDGIRFMRARDLVAFINNQIIDDPIYITKEKYDEYSSISGKVSSGDLLVTGVGSIGVPYLVRDEEPLYFKDGNIIWFKNRNVLDGLFFYYCFQGSTIQDYIYAVAGRGTVSTYTIESGKKTNILYPCLEEQRAIADVLENMSNLITLHQRKLENLKLKKKALLQKLFPKNGEQFPELRFPGFTDAWEQRKFSEITVNIGKRNKENLNLEPYAITKDDGFIPQAEAHDEFGYMKETDRKAYNIVKPNSFGYNPARINVGSIGYYSGTEDIIVSSLYEIFQTSENIYDRFLWHWFKSKQFQNWIERLQEGSVRLYFYYDKLCECEIFIPTVDEQIKIGNSLDRFDNLITLHQRKLEHLQLQKKALLQQMFV